MTSLAHVLAEAGPGVHVWRSERSDAAVRAEAAEIGWRCVTIDGTHIRSKECFLEECERSYRFPAWFGHNWDALADCLADLSWLPPPARDSGTGILTVFDDCDVFAGSALADYDIALEVWEEVAEAWRRIGVPFTVLVRPGKTGSTAPSTEVTLTDLPNLSAPATRALASIEVTTLTGLSAHTEAEVAALHGMGPKAMAALRAALAERGLGFAD